MFSGAVLPYGLKLDMGVVWFGWRMVGMILEDSDKLSLKLRVEGEEDENELIGGRTNFSG